MFENVPIQKRWKVIIAIIAFAFAFSLVYAWQVWDIYVKVEALERKTAVVQDADLEIINRQVILKELSDQISGPRRQDSLSSHVQLMQYIEAESYRDHLQIISLPKEQVQNIDGYNIASVDFAVAGSYHDILRLIYQVEAVDHVGSVSRSAIELRTLNLDAGSQPILVASITLNRLLQTPKSEVHEAS